MTAPLYAAQIAGSGAIMAWIIGGLATAVIALTFAELSVLFPVAGGTAQIPQLSHGSVTSFAFSWIVWLSALAMAPIALLCLRRELPLEKRSFKLPLPEILCFFAFYFRNLICYWTGWDTIYKLAMAIGFVFLMLASVRGRLQSKNLSLRSSLWVFPYLGGLVLVSYLGSFGGGRNVIHFGWDFFVIAVFSFVVLCLAVKSWSHAAAANFAQYQQLEALTVS